MSAKEWFSQKLQTLENDVEFLTYKANLNFTENMLKILNEKGVKHVNKYLAEKLNCSPAYVSKLLNGNPNLTIKKMTKIALILDHELQINLVSMPSTNAKKSAAKDKTLVNAKKNRRSAKAKSLQRREKIQL